MTQEQTPQTQTYPVPGEAGSLDAAALAFETRETAQAEEAVSDEEQPEAEEQAEGDDPNAEADQGDSDEDTDAAELVEVELDGKTFKVPAEVEKGILRQADYSRKMNAVAAQEKVYAQRVEQAETLIAGAEKLAATLAEVKVIDARLKAYEAVDWQTLRAENPAEFAARAAEMQMLRLGRSEAEQKARSVSAEVESAKGQASSQARAEMFAELPKRLKGWNDQMGEKLTEYAEANGVKRETLQSLTDPGMVVALEKARKYDDLQAAKTTLKAKAANAPPVLKPGQPKRTNAQDDAMTNLRKYRTQDAAEAAFLSRMR